MTADEIFELALKFTLSAEGGWTIDSGGPTSGGITQTAYSAWLKEKGMPDADVRHISDQERRQVYYDDFWVKPGISMLADAGLPKLAIATFDFGVNAGPSKAIQHLQRALGTRDDGVLGPGTCHAAKVASQAGEDPIVTACITDRSAFYLSLHSARNEHGWLNRDKNLQKYLETIQG